MVPGAALIIRYTAGREKAIFSLPAGRFRIPRECGNDLKTPLLSRRCAAHLFSPKEEPVYAYQFPQKK